MSLQSSYILKSGLFAEYLSIDISDEAVDESPYLYSNIKVKKPTATPTPTPSKSSSSSSSSSSAKTGEAVEDLLTPYRSARNSASSTKYSDIQEVTLKIIVTGSYEDCQAFIDDICTKESVRITGFEWSEVDKIEVVNSVTGKVEMVDSGLVRLNIRVKLYMADIEDYDSVVSDAVNEATA